MKQFHFLVYFIVIFLSISSHCFSQVSDNKMPTNIGLYLGGNMNMHSPDFSIEGSLFAPINNGIKFGENKNAFGLNAGIIANFPLSKEFILSARLGYNGLSGELNGKNFAGDTSYKLDASMHAIELTPVLEIHNILIDNLYLLGGLEFDYLVNKKYSVIENTNNTEIAKDKDIVDAGFRLALALGLGYVFNLSDNVFLTPEASFRIPIIPVTNNYNFKTWNVPQLRFGLSLTFGLSKDDELPIDDSQSNLEVGVREVRYIDNIGKEYPLKIVKVEDLQYTELFPLVPYIFCDEDKVEPTEQTQYYHGGAETGEFSIQSLAPDAIDINKRTLDIIGNRMNKIRNAELTIIGTNDNKKEKGKSELSHKRAEFARDYLVNNYKINSERINVKSSDLPEKPSAVSNPDGIAENRRIEFSSSNPALLEPIVIQKENQRLAEPNHLKFLLYTVSSDSIKNWKFELFQGDKKLRTFNGSGIPEPLDWIILPNDIAPSQVPLDYNFTVENTKGLIKKANGTIPVEYYSTTRKKTEELPDKIISKFSLILFDFDKSEISKDNMRIIEEHIIPAIKFNSTIKIYGYTDRIGDEKYNRELAERRAKAVQKILSEKIPSANFEVFGVGENNIIFDNDIPTGRQLSRTVQIHVISPK